MAVRASEVALPSERTQQVQPTQVLLQALQDQRPQQVLLRQILTLPWRWCRGSPTIWATV